MSGSGGVRNGVQEQAERGQICRAGVESPRRRSSTNTNLFAPDVFDANNKERNAQSHGVATNSFTPPEDAPSPDISSSAPPSSPLFLMGKEAREILEKEACAEPVTLLWIEVCDRARELRQPGGCEEVFRPQNWPIITFPENFEPPPPPVHQQQQPQLAPNEGDERCAPAARLAAGGTTGKGSGSGGGPRRRLRFAVAVTGFVGSERAGWERLIERMGAQMCKSLKKRVTTHLVCKEVRAVFWCRWGTAGQGRFKSDAVDIVPFWRFVMMNCFHSIGVLLFPKGKLYAWFGGV